jgi:branched-chain amino acid aminotransferase
MPYAIFNGKIIEQKNANIPIADKGYWFDFTVYSSIKVIQSKIFFAKYHIDRLFESAELIGINHQFSKKETIEWLDLLVKKNKIKDALLRIVLIGDVDVNKEAKLYIFSVGGLTYYPHVLYKKGAKVITYHGERRIAQAKTKDLLLSLLAFRQAKKAGALDALMVDHDGNIREGTRSNFFAIINNKIITPPKDKVLEGITKKFVLEVAKDRFEIIETDIPLKDIDKYDEFFITSTSMNVMPISQIDDFEIKTKFEKTRLIGKLFKDYYDKKVLGK